MITSVDGLDNSLPVVVNLHGAGIEADSDQVRHMFDGAPDLEGWLVSPTGMTPWSGDDWRDYEELILWRLCLADW